MESRKRAPDPVEGLENDVADAVCESEEQGNLVVNLAERLEEVVRLRHDAAGGGMKICIAAQVKAR